jgi:hypothetical protein
VKKNLDISKRLEKLDDNDEINFDDSSDEEVPDLGWLHASSIRR